MAPIETEYGRKIDTGNGNSIFVHDDDIDAVVTSRREKDTVNYFYHTAHHSIKLTLRIECDSTDEGGVIKSKLTRSMWRTKLLHEAEVTIKGNTVEQSIEVADGVVIGYRSKHRDPIEKSQSHINNQVVRQSGD